MRFVSLFAGVGGFDLAFERAGMEPVAQVEIDAKCREVLAKHWRKVPKFEDVHDVSGFDLGTVDVLCGGFPCQDYSVAGLRGGLAGDRGALWWQFHRLIAECRPRWVVGENVPGLLSSNGGRDFGSIVGSLVELGYGVVWRVLDAQYFGVAQRRRRVFIVGHIGGIPRPEILALAEGCAGDTPPGREPREEIAGPLGSITGGTRQDLDGQGAYITAPVTSKWSRGTGGPSGDEAQNLIAFTQNSRDEVRDLNNLAGALAAQPGMKQTKYLAQPLRANRWGGADSHGDEGNVVLASYGVRRLTPLECERLQGFPDNWTASQSDTQRYRQMGNAVAVPVVEWIGRNLMDAA